MTLRNLRVTVCNSCMNIGEFIFYVLNESTLSNQSEFITSISQSKESIRDASEIRISKNNDTHIIKPTRAANEGSNTCQAISQKTV